LKALEEHLITTAEARTLGALAMTAREWERSVRDAGWQVVHGTAMDAAKTRDGFRLGLAAFRSVH
jgi:hypothetical protein